MKAKKIAQIATIILFCMFLSVPLLSYILTYEKEFSDLENRTLAKKPVFTLSSLWNRSYQKKSEDAFNDQFMFRDSFISLNTLQDYVLGNPSIQNVYFGKDGYLLVQDRYVDETIWKKNIESINAFVNKQNIPTYLMLVPSTRTILPTKLPNNHDDVDEDIIAQNILNSLSQQIHYVDAFQALRNHYEEEIFYKSDHHWSALGSYYGYEAFQTIRHQPSTPLGSKKIIKSEFQGSLYARSKATWYSDDEVAIYRNPPTVNVSYDGLESNQLYFEENAQKRDAYTYFMDGNHAVVEIATKSTNEHHILIVRDSYAQSFAPYLANDVSNLSLLDLRYYKGSVSTYIQEHHVDEVLFLYSMDTLLNTRDVTTLK